VTSARGKQAASGLGPTKALIKPRFLGPWLINWAALHAGKRDSNNCLYPCIFTDSSKILPRFKKTKKKEKKRERADALCRVTVYPL
jgi:hypothetical protein